MVTKVGVRDLIRSSSILKGVWLCELGDIKSHKLIGVFSKATIVKPKK